MEKISMPTDIFLRMLDWDLDADEQLLYLALILNRLVNMTGVYAITHREMRHQIPPRDNDRGWLIHSLEKLQAKRLVYYDDGILFIPLIPETSSYARHVFRHRMQLQVDRLAKKHPANVALLAFADWCAANVSPDNRSTTSEIQVNKEPDQNQLTSDKNHNHEPRQTLAEKYANLSHNKRFASPFNDENSTFPTDKNKERLTRGSKEAPQSHTRAPSSSSSLSSSYYTRRSTGIDVKGGAGGFFAEAGDDSDFDPSQSSDFGPSDDADNDDEEADR